MNVNLIQNTIFIILLILSLALIAFPPFGLKIFGIILLLYTLAGIKIIYQYERGVLFTLGRYQGIFNPGFIWVAPIIQTLQKIDLRVRAIDISKQEVMTKDNVPVKINIVVFFKVDYPEKTVLNVQDYIDATALYAQTVMRDVIGGVELDELLQNRDKIAEEIRSIVDEITDQWGINVVGVRLQDIELPEELKRAMARQAEAERERRAVIIKSEGEVKAAENLIKAAKMFEGIPEALHLRTLHTLADISSDPNQKLVILLPMELVKAFIKEKRK